MLSNSFFSAIFFLMPPQTTFKVIPLQKPSATKNCQAQMCRMTILSFCWVPFANNEHSYYSRDSRIVQIEFKSSWFTVWDGWYSPIVNRACVCLWKQPKNALPEGFYLLMTFRMTFKVSKRPSFAIARALLLPPQLSADSSVVNSISFRRQRLQFTTSLSPIEPLCCS